MTKFSWNCLFVAKIYKLLDYEQMFTCFHLAPRLQVMYWQRLQLHGKQLSVELLGFALKLQGYALCSYMNFYRLFCVIATSINAQSS